MLEIRKQIRPRARLFSEENSEPTGGAYRIIEKTGMDMSRYLKGTLNRPADIMQHFSL